MKALSLPLHRPVGTGALYLAILLLGVFSLQRLPIALTPDTDYPRMTVLMQWPNASPEEMEALVTSRIESETHRIPGVREVSSESNRGYARINMQFERDTAMDRAEILLSDRLASLQEELPQDVLAPVIDRWQPSAMDREDFMSIQVSGPRTADALRQLIDERLIPRLLGVPGVSGLEVYGGSPREIRVDVDPVAVQKDNVAVADLGSALEQIGRDESLGSVPWDNYRAPVVADRSEPSAAALRDHIVGGSPERPLRFSEVARLTDTWQEPVRLARFNGNPSIQVVLERESATNLIEVADAVRREVDLAGPELPKDIHLEIVQDQSKSIRKEISVLARRSAVSICLIFLVLLITSGRYQPTAVVLGSVLFSALATFLLFRLMGLGIDLVTLSGLALAFGMAVDNSIVLLENIELRSRRHSTSKLRTLAATREVLFPLLAGTLTTAVVLTPFLYISGELRDYYLPFVLAVCLSLVASLGVALTLTPLLSRWALRATHSRVRIPQELYSLTVVPGHWAARQCFALMDFLLRLRWVTAVLAVLLLAGSVWIFQTKISRGSIFPPNTDTMLSVALGLPPGSEITQSNALISEFEQAVLDHEFYEKGYVEQVETLIGESRAYLMVRFDPAVSRTTIPAVLKDELILRASTVAGASVSVMGKGPGYNAGGGSVSASYQLNLRGPDYLTLASLAEDIAARLKRNGRIQDVNPNASSWISDDAVEFAAVPERRSMAGLGVTMASLVNTIQPAIAGQYANRRVRGPSGDVFASIRYTGGQTLEVHEFLGTAVRGPVSDYFVDDVLGVEERKVQGAIHRRQQEYERIISFEYRGPRRVGNRFTKSFVEGTAIPSGYTLEDGSGIYLSSRDERQILQSLGLALLLIYMVSAALFESLVLPFVAILAVPLSFIGISLVFWITGEPFDRTAYIGLILLAGIAINNALLLVHRAGAVFQKTKNGVLAAKRAARERFRPILLTTATSVAGLAPLAWGVDPASTASWRTLAISATAGLLAAAVCTLGVIPPLFSLFVRGGASPAAASDITLSTGEEV